MIFKRCVYSMARRRFSLQAADDGPGYWPSFVDIMSVVVLVLLFVLLTAFIQTAVQIEQRVQGKQAIQELMDRRLAVTKALESELGKEYVSISSDGNISFKGDVLFLPDSAELRNTKEVDTLMSRLAHSVGNVLVQARFRDGLQMILVEGHTAADEKDVSSHWALSAQRAERIVLALQEQDARLRDPANAQFLGAAGRAFYRPAQIGSSEAVKAMNRRVEIRLVLKDEGLRDALLEALSN
jgi:chemotaxis protein MotB